MRVHNDGKGVLLALAPCSHALSDAQGVEIDTALAHQSHAFGRSAADDCASERVVACAANGRVGAMVEKEFEDGLASDGAKEDGLVVWYPLSTRFPVYSCMSGYSCRMACDALGLKS
jgi:hypothetical protein